MGESERAAPGGKRRRLSTRSALSSPGPAPAPAPASRSRIRRRRRGSKKKAAERARTERARRGRIMAGTSFDAEERRRSFCERGKVREEMLAGKVGWDEEPPPAGVVGEG